MKKQKNKLIWIIIATIVLIGGVAYFILGGYTKFYIECYDNVAGAFGNHLCTVEGPDSILTTGRDASDKYQLDIIVTCPISTVTVQNCASQIYSNAECKNSQFNINPNSALYGTMAHQSLNGTVECKKP